jgi:CheY-like chemotaxis protein
MGVANIPPPPSGWQSARRMDFRRAETDMIRNAGTMLLVEDNPADVFFVRVALEREGIKTEILIANDGEKAIQFVEAAETNPAAPCPQLILLDLNLPRTSGTEVLRRLKKSPRCADVPVIVVTSSDAPSDRAEVARLGATRYFLKPQNIDDYMKLGSIVKEVL